MPSEAYSCVEFFAGTRWVSKCFRWAGHPTASLDINMQAAGVAQINPYDLTTTAGMAQLDSKPLLLSGICSVDTYMSQASGTIGFHLIV